MELKQQYDALQGVLGISSEAYALVSGSKEYPDIHGKVEFYSIWGGTVVCAAITGLPVLENGGCGNRFHGFHIHEGSSCAQGQSSEAAFPLTGNHYNPQGCSHPAHAGDLPPLLSNDGFAFQIFYTNQFVPEEILGKTVVIHSMADDFTSQPSGNSGVKIACGEIQSAWSFRHL